MYLFILLFSDFLNSWMVIVRSCIYDWKKKKKAFFGLKMLTSCSFCCLLLCLLVWWKQQGMGDYDCSYHFVSFCNHILFNSLHLNCCMFPSRVLIELPIYENCKVEIKSYCRKVYCLKHGSTLKKDFNKWCFRILANDFQINSIHFTWQKK